MVKWNDEFQTERLTSVIVLETAVFPCVQNLPKFDSPCKSKLVTSGIEIIPFVEFSLRNHRN